MKLFDYLQMVLPTVLKRRHSLRGKSLVPLFARIQNAGEPKEFARFNKDEPLEDLSPAALADRFADLTGEDMVDVLGAAGKDDSSRRLLLHSAIILANEIGQPEGQRLKVGVYI